MSDAFDSIPEHDPDVAQMLAAYAAETSRAPAQIDVALRQVTAKLAAPAAATTAGVASVVAKLAIAGVVATAGAWWALRPAAGPSPAAVAGEPRESRPDASHEAAPMVDEAAPVIDEPAPVVHEPTPTFAESPSRDDAPTEPPPQTFHHARTPKRPAERVADAMPRVSLADELRLLKEARTALRVGDGARALDRVRAHRQRYPSSPLAEERDATEVMALCALGRADDARTMAASHERLYGRSQQPLLTTCSERPNPGDPR